jgi:hypothetical protein
MEADLRLEFFDRDVNLCCVVRALLQVGLRPGPVLQVKKFSPMPLFITFKYTKCIFSLQT